MFLESVLKLKHDLPIDLNFCTRYVLRSVRCQEQDEVRDVFRRPEPLERNVLNHLRPDVFRHRRRHRRVDELHVLERGGEGEKEKRRELETG